MNEDALSRILATPSVPLPEAVRDRFVMVCVVPWAELMDHVTRVISQGGKAVGPEFRVTAWGIGVAASHFGSDKNELLEFINTLISVYAYRKQCTGSAGNMDFGYALAEGKKIADELAMFGGGGADLVRHYYNLGINAGMTGHQDMVAALMASALKHCGDDDTLANPVLRQLEAVYKKEYGPTGPCPKLAAVLERLLDFDQINEDEDNERRFRLIDHYRSTGRFKKVREVLAPLVIKLQSFDYTMFQIVCHGMADSYAQEGRMELAASWAAGAREQRPAEHRN